MTKEKTVIPMMIKGRMACIDDIFALRKRLELMAKMTNTPIEFDDLFENLVTDIVVPHMIADDVDVSDSNWQLKSSDFVRLTPLCKPFFSNCTVHSMKALLLMTRRQILQDRKYKRQRFLKQVCAYDKQMKYRPENLQMIACENEDRLTPLIGTYYYSWLMFIAHKKLGTLVNAIINFDGRKSALYQGNVISALVTPSCIKFFIGKNEISRDHWDHLVRVPVLSKVLSKREINPRPLLELVSKEEK